MSAETITALNPAGLRKAVFGLKSIAHSGRLKILCSLLDGREMTVNQLSELTGESQSAVSQHLTKMRASGILMNRRDGNQIFYSVQNPDYSALVAALCSIYGSSRRGRSKS